MRIPSQSYATRGDVQELLEVERECFDYPWTEEEFLNCFRMKRRFIKLQLDPKTYRILGFIVYDYARPAGRNPNDIRIVSLAVRPEVRRQSVGRSLLLKLVEKVLDAGGGKIVLEICESNLAAQLFFKQHGFRATKIVKMPYDDTDLDAYRMELQLQVTARV